MTNTLHYDFIVRKLRAFFQKKGFIEVPSATRLSILAACEDPSTIRKFTLGGIEYPLPQTGQMWLELELLKNPTWPGVFCLGPSYRDEQNAIPGRHYNLFPMFDFEGQGSFEELQAIESELLTYIGFDAPIGLNYDDACSRYDTQLLETEHETMMCKEISTVISLEKFPERSNPYWNMKYIGNGIFNKIDIILYGMETIGSAERSCNKKEMYHFFETISNGQYASLLFEQFGKDRVQKELDEYFSFNFFPRFGGGIGLTRLESAMEKAELFDIKPMYTIAKPAYTQPVL